MAKIDGYNFFSSKQTALTSTTPSGYTGGGGTNRRLTSVFVPANTFAAGDVLFLHVRMQKIGTAATLNWNLFWNTTDSLTSATTLATRGLGATLIDINGQRRAGIITSDGSGSAGSTGGTIMFGTGSGIDRDFSVNVAGAPSFVGINWTTNSYILLSAATSSTDTVRSIFLKVSN